MNLLDQFTPNFIWRDQNALVDYGLIIEQELPYIVAKRKYEEITITGSNKPLHEWFEDYEPFDLEIPNVSIPYENFSKVKQWLIGKSKLITHNDLDKFCYAMCNISGERPYQNEWGVFYTFSIVFRCDPLKYKVNETPFFFTAGNNTFENHGDEKAAPLFEIDSNGGDIILECGEYKLTILNTTVGLVTIDNELSMIVQNKQQLRSKGRWLRIPSGKQTIKLTGNIKSCKMNLRSVYL